MKLTQSICFRLMLIISVLIIGTLLVVSGGSYYFVNKYLNESLNQTEQAVASKAAVQVKNEIDRMLLGLDDIANTTQVLTGDKKQIQPVLHKAKQRFTMFDGIVFASLDGVTINDSGASINISDREYFQKVVNTREPYVSEVYLNRVTQKQTIYLCVPVVRDGELIGIVFGSYSLDKMASIVKEIKFKQQGYGALLENSGVYLAHPDRTELVGNMNINTGEISSELQQTLGDNAKIAPELMTAFKETIEKNTRTRFEYTETNGSKQVRS